MKYYIGRIQVRDGLNQYDADACIVAKNEAQAQQLLETRAQMYGGDDGEPAPGGWFGFDGDTVATRAEGLTEISPVTFSEMSRLLPVFGEKNHTELADEALDERTKTLARRIGNQLVKLDAKVAHSKLLHAVAASLGENDWQVLVHSQTASAVPVKAASTEALGWPDNGQVQPFIPGTGYLYGVPVTVDTTMTAFLKVRARDEEEAMALARQFAQEGNAKFEIDEGNYRGLGDHYVGDKESVYRLNDTEPALPANVQEGTLYAQRGAYKVSLCDLGDEDDTLLWADLDVFDVSEEEPLTESCLSSCPRDASPEETLAFCVRIAELLNRAAPDPSSKDWISLKHAFVQAVQGDTSEQAYANIEAKLSSMP